MKKTYENDVAGVRILPGQWRPHYQFEQIAWVSPPWPSQDYVWLDFPEAIFTSTGLLFLSHNNPDYPPLFPNQLKVAWQQVPGGLSFVRTLPNQIKFGGSVTVKNKNSISLKLFIDNQSQEPLTSIKLQTCTYLRGIKEFGDYTLENKFVRVPQAEWQPFDLARNSGEQAGRFLLGWREGPAAADWPVMVTLSNQAERLIAMTWYENTYSLIGNPRRPCMHADPFFPDLNPGAKAEIEGELIFFEGILAEFTEIFEEKLNYKF